MKRLYKILFVLTFIHSIHVNAQTDQLNLKKYWWYHYRLVNDFLAKGDCQGCSSPMGERGYNITNTISGAKWGDQIICLGNYIAVLATEYKLLRDNNQLTDTTVQELYYALKAFNRLDEEAETFFYNINATPPLTQSSANLNGFFMRDDVYSTFLDDHPKLKNGIASSTSINTVYSDYYDAVAQGFQPGTWMSHDQIWHLFSGFALMARCLPIYSPIEYKIKNSSGQWVAQSLNNYDGNTNIRQEALNITNRIMTYLQNNDWKVKQPDGNLVVNGPNPWYLLYGASEATCYINNVLSDPDFLPAPAQPTYAECFPFVHSCNTYQYEPKVLSNIVLFQGYGLGPVHEDYKVEQLAAIGNCWYDNVSLTYPNPVPIMEQIISHPIYYANPNHAAELALLLTSLLPQPPHNITAISLAGRQYAATLDYGIPGLALQNWHMPLLRQVLHGGINPIPDSKYTDLINSAPCNGPYCYHYTGGNCATFEWSADSRVYDEECRIPRPPYGYHKMNGDNIGSPDGEYNGLDYMLYYNLYHIIQGNTVATVNYMDRVITIPYPSVVGGITFGNSGNPTTVEAFNTITASNTVNNNADVTYHAGEEIALLPGFQAQAGSEFAATVQRFHCATDGEYRKPIASTDSNNQSPTENLVAYTGQTTFVNYPKETDNIESASNSDNNPIVQNTNSSALVNTQGTVSKTQTVSGISIIPNPNNGTFQIVVTHNNQPIGIKDLKVFDMMGKAIWSSDASSNTVFSIDISAYSAGIYYVRSINELEEMEIKKLIKQ
ncbi:MAG: hypothetical protein A3F72_12145 [Bacteroidetes bacterium RIFCSPLOWO2_12_FULL_35_15]|nr:MAG: hypothetical protein A3F72_12145 [Bacteroidetes bacterium RIFCSPLOWO2_12_FULL_35_15]